MDRIFLTCETNAKCVSDFIGVIVLLQICLNLD